MSEDRYVPNEPRLTPPAAEEIGRDDMPEVPFDDLYADDLAYYSLDEPIDDVAIPVAPDEAAGVAGPPGEAAFLERPEAFVLDPALAEGVGVDDEADVGVPVALAAEVDGSPEPSLETTPVAALEGAEPDESAEIPPFRANADVLPAAAPRRRLALPRLGRRGLAVAAALVGAVLLTGAGAAYATYEYHQRYDGKILPGARIAGVAVGGMSPDAAMDAVAASIRPQLTRTIKVTWKGRTWKVTPEKLGARSNAREAIDAALRASETTSLWSKARMRLLGDELTFQRDVAITYPRQGARGFVEGIASSLDREVRDAGIDYSTGWVELTPERTGRQVDVRKSRRALLRALANGSSTVPLAVREIEPETTVADLDQVLLLRIGENKLYLYQNGEITHTWTVATGQPEYPTPTGLYSVTEKRYMPTWVNPDPDGWGADMPASIPPGPGNPLGTRALNWSAPAIRFHGTQAEYSLGYNASHGCVRMAMPDVELLYDLVDVGTPIVSITAGSLKPMYASGPDPTPVEDGESNQSD